MRSLEEIEESINRLIKQMENGEIEPEAYVDAYNELQAEKSAFYQRHYSGNGTEERWY